MLSGDNMNRGRGSVTLYIGIRGIRVKKKEYSKERLHGVSLLVVLTFFVPVLTIIVSCFDDISCLLMVIFVIIVRMLGPLNSVQIVLL